MFSKYKVLLWDFDGVIMDSMPIRSNGFKLVLNSYPEDQVEQLMRFHNENGGLSRYVKFRYFFETIRGESITEERVQELASSFSTIMLEALINQELLIADSLSFIKKNYGNFDMHIVSGSDGNELRNICGSLNLSGYFSSINGSPTHKNVLVKQIIESRGYKKEHIVLIGDSKNDYDASVANGIDFFGYNNELMKKYSNCYIDRFANL